MQRFVKIPLMFLFIGSILGVFLRWQFLEPTPHVQYTFFLHGHSHIMFLGWVFNALFIGFVINHIREDQQRSFKYLFIALQILVIGMLISFPIQGYGFFSILLSTLHTLLAIIFFIQFFRKTKGATSTSVRFARVALIFFAISAAGPFSLGYLMSSGLGQSKWYFFSIYFYLHFQYNGFFLFGIFSLFFNLLEKHHIKFDLTKARSVRWLLTGACVPAYLLSTLWAQPGYIYNIVGGAAALVQIAAFIILIRLLSAIASELRSTFRRVSIHALQIAMICFATKLVLQQLSALPAVARMAYELRPVTIAYLHLVLVGVISLFLLTWYLESDSIREPHGKKAIYFFIIAFFGMEVCLTLYPWWTKIVGQHVPSAATFTFTFSVLLSMSCLAFLATPQKRNDESHTLR